MPYFRRKPPRRVLHNHNPEKYFAYVEGNAPHGRIAAHYLIRTFTTNNISTRKTCRNIFRLGALFLHVSPEYALDGTSDRDRVLYWSLQGMHLLKIEWSSY